MVLLLSGLIPYSKSFGRAVNQLTKFGDVWEMSYPDCYANGQDLLVEVTRELRQLKYSKLVLVGLSFGGTLSYLLLRYWRRHRVPFETLGVVAVSTPFGPEDITWRSKIELNFGYEMDRHADKLWRTVLQVLYWLWENNHWSDGHPYTIKNSLQRVYNAVRVGYLLRQTRLIRKTFRAMPALLLNTARGIKDPFVLRTNENHFKEIFPQGQVVYGLTKHASLNSQPTRVYRQLNRFLSTVTR